MPGSTIVRGPSPKTRKSAPDESPITLYLQVPRWLATDLDDIAAREKRSRPAQAAFMLEKAVRALKP